MLVDEIGIHIGDDGSMNFYLSKGKLRDRGFYVEKRSEKGWSDIYTVAIRRMS